MRARTRSRGLCTAFVLTIALMLLTAAGVADLGWRFPVAAVGVTALALAGLHLIFHGAFFAIGFADALAIHLAL